MTHLHLSNWSLADVLRILSPFASEESRQAWEQVQSERLVRQRMVANVHAPRLLLEGCL